MYVCMYLYDCLVYCKNNLCYTAYSNHNDKNKMNPVTSENEIKVTRLFGYITQTNYKLQMGIPSSV